MAELSCVPHTTLTHSIELHQHTAVLTFACPRVATCARCSHCCTGLVQRWVQNELLRAEIALLPQPAARRCTEVHCTGGCDEK